MHVVVMVWLMALLWRLLLMHQVRQRSRPRP